MTHRLDSHFGGWLPQKPDHRDRYFHLEETVLTGVHLPVKVDIANRPPIWDQGQLGSCTAHGSLRAYLIEAKRQGVKVPMLSRLMQYYDTRELEGTVDQDAGAAVRDTIKALARRGCAPESDWPYITNQFAERPSDRAYQDATQHLAVKYQAVVVGGPGAPIRTALASGLAVVFGFSVPESFEDGSWDPATEVLPLPGISEQFIGGHCVTLTGYDWSRSDHPAPYFVADNSWAATWGDKGRFRLAWDWFDPWRGLASDLWVIQGTKDA